MSAKFRLEKKKAQQEELRKLMKLNATKRDAQADRVDSPLAKYNKIGQLTCIVCVSVVTAPWKVHLNTNRHKEAVQAALDLKNRAQQKAANPKRPATPPPQPTKKLKGILKNSKSRKQDEDEDEEMSQNNSTPSTAPKAAEVANDIEPAKNEIGREENIPEGFFDDPVMDAKARNIQYKDPIEEEWEAFQKEIKEETNASAAIIAGEHEEATAERQIEEIDEQIRIWSKVLDLERKKEETRKQKADKNNTAMDCDEKSSDEDEDFDEYLDWRAKKS